MVKIYLDRNVDVRALKKAINYPKILEQIKLLQWPLEGKTKRVKDYGLPAGEITWDDLAHITWDRLDFCTWNDFSPTESYESIVLIIGKQHRRDCIHFDIAVKNRCAFYLTSDKDFLHKRVELKKLSGIQIFDPVTPDSLQDFKNELQNHLAPTCER